MKVKVKKNASSVGLAFGSMPTLTQLKSRVAAGKKNYAERAKRQRELTKKYRTT